MTQMAYHEAVTNSPQWLAAFCYPEGLMRWWAEFSLRDIEVFLTPHQVLLTAGVADNFVRKILIGQEHVEQVPQWYGESVGFWDGNHSSSGRPTSRLDVVALDVRVQQFAQIIEVFPPAETGKGLVVEATFYDPEAFQRPLHTVTPWSFAPVSTTQSAGTRSSNAACRARSSTGPTDGRRSSRSPMRATSTTSAALGRRTGRSISSKAWDEPAE